MAKGGYARERERLSDGWTDGAFELTYRGGACKGGASYALCAFCDFWVGERECSRERRSSADLFRWVCEKILILPPRVVVLPEKGRDSRSDGQTDGQIFLVRCEICEGRAERGHTFRN